MGELKTFEDLYYFLEEDFGSFALFGHTFYPDETSRDSTWFHIYNYYECNKCELRVENYNGNIIMFETNTGTEIDKKLLLVNNLPTCEKRCNEKIIKEIIE